VVAYDEHVKARVDMETGAVTLFRHGPDGEELLAHPGPDFDRQAAQSVRGAVGRLLRGAVTDRLIRDVGNRRGEMIDGLVERQDGPNWYLRAADFEVLLPPEEQVPAEVMTRSKHLKVVIVDVRRRGREALVVVSRTHPLLLRRLLEQEVPEVASGQVEVRAIAREPGRRAKVAVHAPAGGLDPRGACIGPRGVRHRSIVAEMGEEQVQIVLWSPDPAEYVANALAPATVLDVALDDESRTASVTVPADRLSLAIGRGGENARLVARLTGWRIDIVPDVLPEPEAAGPD
jgi:N utilization substance protein A